MATESSPRPLVIQASIAILAQCSIGLFLMTSYAILECIGLAEKFKTLEMRRKRTDRTLLWLICPTFLTIGFYIGTILMYTVNWTGNDDGCRLFGRPFIPGLWFISKQFIYYFLYERSCIVHDSLKMSRGNFAIYRTVIAVFIVLGVPAAFYWAFFIIFDAKVIQPEGFCVIIFGNPTPIIVFAGMDVLFSVFLLVLFAYPLYQHLKSVSLEHRMHEDKLYKLMKRNMALSLCITFATFCNLIASVVLISFHGSGTTEDYDHLRIYGMFFAAWDGSVSITLCLAMTKAWMPKALAKRVKLQAEEDVASSKHMYSSKRISKREDETIHGSSFVSNGPAASGIVAPSSGPM